VSGSCVEDFLCFGGYIFFFFDAPSLSFFSCAILVFAEFDLS
jgi:heme exporter protein D